MSASNNDTKILSEQYSSIYKSLIEEDRWDEMRKNDPKREAEYKAKLYGPAGKDAYDEDKARHQAEYDKTIPYKFGSDKTEDYTPEYSLSEIQRIFEHKDGAMFTEEQLAGAMKNLAEGPDVQKALYHAVSYLNDAMEYNQSARDDRE